jgi:hypothetical protein
VRNAQERVLEVLPCLRHLRGRNAGAAHTVTGTAQSVTLGAPVQPAT